MQEKIRTLLKRPKENDSSHGMRVWQAGQQRSTLRPDWDAVKIEMMYRINVAKYAANSDLQQELLSTGNEEMVGAGSTGWTTKLGKSANWSEFNGIIQMRIREELKSPEDRQADIYERIKQQMDEYLEGEGGSQVPIPDAPLMSVGGSHQVSPS